MTNLKVEIDVRCSECRHELNVYTVDYQNTSIEIGVEPCSNCTYSQDALDEAFNDGRRDADGELEQKIADLQDEIEALKEENAELLKENSELRVEEETTT